MLESVAIHREGVCTSRWFINKPGDAACGVPSKCWLVLSPPRVFAVSAPMYGESDADPAPYPCRAFCGGVPSLFGRSLIPCPVLLPPPSPVVVRVCGVFFFLRLAFLVQCGRRIEPTGRKVRAWCTCRRELGPSFRCILFCVCFVYVFCFVVCR